MSLYRRRRGILSWLVGPVLCVCLLAGIFGIVWLSAKVTSTEYRIGLLDREKTEALKEEKALYAEMSSLLSIERVAEGEAGLQFPDRQKVVYVRRDTGGVPRTASLRSE